MAGYNVAMPVSRNAANPMVMIFGQRTSEGMVVM
jgi:hypothetical protein